MTLLELLYSARPQAVREKRDELALVLERVDLGQSDFDRAADVLIALAANGRHRAAGAADLLVAACAERAGLALLHYDSDFDTIAAVTRQRVEWVVPRGSVP